MLTIENQHLRVRVKPLGAELCSIFSKKLEQEIMWQPGDEIWNHSSMLLFPNPGRICRDRTIIDGKVRPATMHGFAYNQQFEVVDHREDLLTLRLSANDYTRESFPYEFTLDVTFRLEGDVLYQELAVSNKDSRKMYFCLGAHPGFYLPMMVGESGNDYVLRFDRKQNVKRFATEKGTMLLTGEKTPFLEDATDVQLNEDFFNGGSILLDGVEADTVTLLSLKSGHFVELGIKGFPYMCLWGNPVRNAVICIEPWCGTSDLAGTNQVWETKLGIESADIGETFTRTLRFRAE